MIFLFFRNLLFYYQAYCFDIAAIISEIKLGYSQSLTCFRSISEVFSDIYKHSAYR